MSSLRAVALITAFLVSGSVGLSQTPSSSPPGTQPAPPGPLGAGKAEARQPTSPASQPARQPATQPAAQPATRPASQPAARPVARPTTQPAVKEMSFNAITLDGRAIVVPQDYAGKLVLVSFWATWCPSSGRELPFWREAYEKYHDRGVEFIGLPTDKNRKVKEEQVRRFLQAYSITWPQVFDDAPTLAQKFGVITLPTSFLIDGDTGQVLLQGNTIRKVNLAKQIEALLERRAQAVQQAPATTQP